MTPVRRQYLQIKKKYPQAILLFRLGDFYETFDDDAKLVARELEIALTSREMGKGQRVPLAGIPCHSLESYLARLVGRGYKVAICEQMAEPSQARGIIPREVVRVITPGTVVEPGLLAPKENNYLAATLEERGVCGLAYVDVTTGEFATTQLPLEALQAELERLRAAELLVPRESPLGSGLGVPVTSLDPWVFGLDSTSLSLMEHFGVASLEAYGCAHLPLAVRAAGSILHYLEETQKAALGQLTGLFTYSVDSYMVMDPHTRSNLDLLSHSRSGRVAGSLLSVLDRTRTPMGGRLLRRWVSQPLLEREPLNARQEAIAAFHDEASLRSYLGQVPDYASGYWGYPVMNDAWGRPSGAEALPGGATAFDCDGDGYTGTRENHVTQYLPQTDGDQKVCQEYDAAFPNVTHKPSKRWPSDMNGSAFSVNKVNVQDLAAFTNPIRYLNQNVGTDPNDVRLDLVPGSTVGFHINVSDMAALTSGVSGFPAMLNGARAFGGPLCPTPP